MLILLALNVTVQAQFPQWLWSKHFPSDAVTWDYTANDIIETSNGDLVIAGSMTAPERSIVYVTRMNSEGDTIWPRSYPANGINEFEFNEEALAIIQVPTGGFCLTGYRIVEPSTEGPRAGSCSWNWMQTGIRSVMDWWGVPMHRVRHAVSQKHITKNTS